MKGIALVLALLALGPVARGAEADDLLASTLPENREKAAALLGKQGGTDAAKRLIALLEDDDWGVRMAAIQALGPLEFGPGRDALYEQAVKGEIRAIRMLAARMLHEHAAEASAARLAKRVTKYKKEERLPYIEALGLVGGPEAVAALVGQTRAPDPDHRLAAARALGRLKAGEKGLVRGLKDKELAIRLTAAASLAHVDSDTAREALLEFVEKARKPREAYVLRRIGRRAAAANEAAFAAAVAKRLPKARKPAPLLRLAIHGRLKDCAPAARELLGERDALTRAFAFQVAGLGSEPLPDEPLRKGLDHKDRRVRFAAAEAHLVTAPDAVAAVRTLLAHDEEEVVMAAIRRAVADRMRDVLPELTALAKGKTAAKKAWLARSAACVAMGRVGYDAAFKDLMELAGQREWWLRASAFEGLYHTYQKDVIPFLIDHFNDKSPAARMTAKRNLRYMTTKHYIKKSQYEDWWEKHKDRLELKHPERKIAELDKYGYDTRKYIEDVLRGTDIIAVKGRWDKVELILQELQVRHVAWRAQEVKTFGVCPKQVVLVNCEGSVDSSTTELLQWFVVTGGYMATTDWALVNATTRTFPRVVVGYVKQSTGNDVVVVEPGEPDHPTLKGVFRDGVELQWWLEIQAFPIQVEDPVRSTVLVDSLQMLDRYGSSAMMVEFPAGLGKVLHSTSHFYLQKEGFAHESDLQRRRIFAVDNLGISIPELRELDKKGAFGNIAQDTTPISRSYSMFHMLVNFINEKRAKDLAK